MAIDSRAKRVSMLARALPTAWLQLQIPNGSIDADDRAHLLHLYNGIPLDAPFGDVNPGVDRIDEGEFKDFELGSGGIFEDVTEDEDTATFKDVEQQSTTVR